VTSEAWTLEPNAEREILLPWQLREDDPEVVERVLAYIADVVGRPLARPHLEDERGVFGIKAIPKTNVGLVWLLNVEYHQVVLVHVGPI
jgi:hypothetical protein